MENNLKDVLSNDWSGPETAGAVHRDTCLVLASPSYAPILLSNDATRLLGFPGTSYTQSNAF